MYQQSTAFSARGQSTGVTYGNNVTASYVYDDARGWLKGNTVKNGGTTVQNYVYVLDAVGNVTSRDISFGIGSSANLKETFGYDDVHRVTSRTVNSALNLSGALAMTESYAYDARGNLSHKANTGYYQYSDTTKPNRLTGVWELQDFTGVQSYSFAYDANGNITHDGVRSFDYNSFDKPTRVTQGSDFTEFTYGPNRELIKRIDKRGNDITTTLMLDGYEQITLPSGVVEHKFNVGDAVITKRSNSTSDVFYLHKDQQGSTTAITNANGDTVQQFLYDPWGKQYLVNTSLLTYTSPATSKGYTGHEMVNDFEIIHMGGRTYNPVLGRFMQADPFIQAPGNLQSYNRYSYVFNNPMSYTDPSGYSAWTKFRDKFLKPIAAIAITIYTGGLAAAATSGWAAFGITVAGGAAAGYVSTGSLRGALIGAFSAGAFYGVGSYFDTFNTMTTGLTAAKIGAHGIVGGITNVLSGGKFGHGFMSAGITQAFANSIDEIGGKINGKTSSAWSNTSNRIQRVIAAATVGGTASVVGGGKFGNGALTGAFSRAYNDEAHIQRESESYWDNMQQKLSDVNWSGALGDASYYAGWAGTVALFVPGGQPVAAGLGALSIGLGALSVAADVSDGGGFNETNATGVGHAQAVRTFGAKLTPLLPAQIRLPVVIGLDSYDRVTSSFFYWASANEPSR